MESDFSDEDENISGSPAMANVNTGPNLLRQARRLRHIVGISLRRAVAGNITTNGSQNANDNYKRSENESDSTSNSNNSPVKYAFALYSPKQEPPVYISEPRSGENAEFNDFDLWHVDSRDESLVGVVVWQLTPGSDKWTQCFSQKLNLCNLTYIGPTLETIDSKTPFARNSLIIIMTDGCYIEPSRKSKSMVDLQIKARNLSPAPPSAGRSPVLGGPTSSITYDSLMKIQTLEECIHDSHRAQSDILEKIQVGLDDSGFMCNQNISMLSDQLDRTRNSIELTRSETASIRRQIHHLKSSIQQRRQVLDHGRTLCAGPALKATAKVMGALSASRIVLQALQETHVSHMSRIATHLGQIFPIEPSRKPLQFSICGVYVPDLPTLLNHTFDEDEVGASYGFLAQLVDSLSDYMNVPLRYPIQPLGSVSVIFDPISSIQGSRMFPLSTQGQLLYRFEYATYLLSKNVEQLMSAAYLQTADVSLILANLKNLLLVLSTSTMKENVTT